VGDQLKGRSSSIRLAGWSGRGRIERLMRRHGFRGVAARQFRPVTTDSQHRLPIAPDLLGQDFQAPAPNRA
jgi:putative transposase